MYRTTLCTTHHAAMEGGLFALLFFLPRDKRDARSTCVSFSYADNVCMYVFIPSAHLPVGVLFSSVKPVVAHC